MTYSPKYSSLLPPLSEEEFEALKTSIRLNGIQVPIIIDEQDNVLDGWHRLQVATELRLDDIPVTVKSDLSETQKVQLAVSLNKDRRQMSSSQLATLAVEVEKLLAVAAKERQLAAQNNDAGRAVKEIIPEQEEGQARDQAAASFGTNGRYVSDAKRLEQEAPELFEEVKSGRKTIPQANQELKNENRLPKGGNKINRAGDIYTPQGMDACQTPPYAVDPLLPHLARFKTIWEPACGEMYLAKTLFDSGFDVIPSDILEGQNFFDYEPDRFWDCLITNPPYSIKYQWIERCYELEKPFALLMPVETLGAKSAQVFFKEKGVGVIFLDRRVNFKMPVKGWADSAAQFPVAWFTWGMGLDWCIEFGEMGDASAT